MAWSVLQSLSGNNNTGASTSGTMSITATSNLTAGSKLLAFYNADGTDTTVTWAANDGNGNNFGAVVTYSNATIIAGHTDYIGCLALDTPAGDVGTKPTINIVGTGTFHTWQDFSFLLEVSGLAVGQTSAILDGSVATSGWSTAATATDPTYSSTASNEFLIQFLGDNKDSLGPGSYTAPTGYTSSIKYESTTNGSGGLAWKNSTGGSEAGSDWTFNASTSALLVKVAFQLPTPPPVRPGLQVNQSVKRAAFY